MPVRPAMSEFPFFVDFLLAGILSNILFTLAFQLLKYYMKCPCCNENFSSATDLKKHYVDFHTVDKSNYIFKKLLTRCRSFCPKKCFRCKEFLSNGTEEKVHIFLKHYQRERSAFLPR